MRVSSSGQEKLLKEGEMRDGAGDFVVIAEIRLACSAVGGMMPLD